VRKSKIKTQPDDLAPYYLTGRELATVLAALRYFQANVDDVDALEMSHFDACARLTCDEIDELCERLSLGEAG
jgi:hypothetical protein